MKTNILVLVVLCGWIAANARAEESTLPVSPPHWHYELTPQLSVIQISRLEIPNAGYNVGYTQSIQGLPAFQLSVGRPLADIGNFTFGMQAALGYGSQSGVFGVTGAAKTTASIAMTWVPMLLSAKLVYRIPALNFIRPALIVGAGNVTLLQRSPFTPLNQNVGIPLIVVSPQIAFVDLGDYHWLGGFTFGATFLQGLGAGTRFSATSLDLSLILLL